MVLLRYALFLGVLGYSPIVKKSSFLCLIRRYVSKAILDYLSRFVDTSLQIYMYAMPRGPLGHKRRESSLALSDPKEILASLIVVQHLYFQYKLEI